MPRTKKPENELLDDQLSPSEEADVVEETTDEADEEYVEGTEAAEEAGPIAESEEEMEAEEAPAEEAPAEDEPMEEAQAEETPAEEEPEEPAPAPRRRRRRKAADEEPEETAIKSGVQKASRKERRDLYGGERIYSRDLDKPAETEGDRLRQTYLDLASSISTGKILHGMLTGVDDIGGTVCGIVDYEDYRVYIPQQMLFYMNPEEVPGSDTENGKRYFTKARLGSEVEFIVSGIHEAERIAFASRLAAMQRTIADNYDDTNERGRTRFEEGMIAEVQITAVYRAGISVDIGGVDAFIPLEELSWLHINDAQQEGYAVGNNVLVKIKKIEPLIYEAQNPFNENKPVRYRIKKVTASVKETKEDPSKRYFNDFRVNSSVIAKVTGRSEAGYFVRLGSNKRDALCADTTKRRLPEGTLVSVKITKKQEEGYKIFARIERIIKLPE